MCKKILFFVILYSSVAAAESMSVFRAEYDLKKNNITFGKNINELTEKNGRWSFEINARTSGIFKLKKDERYEKSLFIIRENKLRPILYQFNRNRRDKSQKIETKFYSSEIQNCIPYSLISEQNQRIEHKDPKCLSQDRLSVQIDFREKLKVGKYDAEYLVIDKGRDRKYTFTFFDAGIIDTIFGKTETIIIKKTIQNNKRNTLTWYAVNHDFIPVKIEQYRNKTLKFTVYLTDFTK
jgi:predicted nucleic acid-binding protein